MTLNFGFCFSHLRVGWFFMDDVVIDNQYDGFCTPVSRFQMFQQTDKQHRVFTATANVADLTSSCETIYLFYMEFKSFDTL
jgi:hypothetical protein